MKLSSFCLTALVAVCFVGSVYGGSTSPSQRVYVDATAVSVTKSGIVVQTQGGPVNVRAVRSDSKGIYICQRDVYVGEKGEVVCGNCGLWFPNRGAYLRHLPCPNY